ncbi:MAG: TlpA family protein disulfide reductase [Acidimicrobiia bacterium]|nr:TlpA family protein disulfide reductase [Acidimicrobiia bacterium]MYF26228.1 TlpA family protein disulfide reductase [Acidimicrobiia bacterium]
MSRQGLRLLAAGLVVIGTLAAVFATRLGDGESTGYAALSGSPAPDLTLPRLNGDGSVNLSDLSDTHQVVVVNFFASWCLQCRNEHPDLVSTAAAYQDRSVRFVGVSFQDDPSRSTAFLDELGRGNETEYLTDPGSRAAIEFGIFGVPETVFLSNGVIAGKFLGETDALTLSQALEQLLSGEAIDSRQVGEFRQDPTSDR